MLNPCPQKPRRFPRLILHNYTATHYQGVKFIGPPVRILRTILEWPGRLEYGTWFAN